MRAPRLFPGSPTRSPCASTTTPVCSSAARAPAFSSGSPIPPIPPSMDTTFDPAFLDAVAARVGNRFPFLEDVPISSRKCWAGLYPETPDHHAIIDAAATAPWFIQCVGFGGHGIMHSLAAGQAVTELISEGECTQLRPASAATEPLRRTRSGRRDRGALSDRVERCERSRRVVDQRAQRLPLLRVQRLQRRSDRVLDRDPATLQDELQRRVKRERFDGWIAPARRERSPPVCPSGRRRWSAPGAPRQGRRPRLPRLTPVPDRSGLRRR